MTWKECLEQVLLPLLQVPQEVDANFAELTGARQANAAQLVCRVVLTHLHALAAAPESFPVLFSQGAASSRERGCGLQACP